MSQINPFIGSILQSPQVQRQQAIDKDRQVRRTQDKSKNAWKTDGSFDNQVESAEEVTPVNEESPHEEKENPRHNQKKHSDEEEPHEGLDLTA